MNLDSQQIHAFSLGAAAGASHGLGPSCTLTLHLPTAAQASSPGERPLGSVVKLEVDGKPVTEELAPRAPLTILRPALLTLTF